MQFIAIYGLNLTLGAAIAVLMYILGKVRGRLEAATQLSKARQDQRILDALLKIENSE